MFAVFRKSGTPVVAAGAAAARRGSGIGAAAGAAAARDAPGVKVTWSMFGKLENESGLREGG